MKRLLPLFSMLLVFSFASAQTATDFTATDCAGNSHNLFNQLDNGKVVIICWVMPCSNCVGPAVTAHNLVQNYQTTHPNRVVMYLVDDYANTPCTSLNSWAAQNNLSNAVKFSSTAINMAHYGTAGMPKTVVVGGPNHSVFYNVNNTSSQSALQNAINSALAASPAATVETAPFFTKLELLPNPAEGKSTISVQLKKPSNVTISLYNQIGKKVSDVYAGAMSVSEKQIDINTTSLATGMYFVKIHSGGKSYMLKLVVTH